MPVRNSSFALLITLILGACRVSGPSEEQRIHDAVSATLAAIPVATLPATGTPFPTQTPLPTADPNGVFCEYGFCLGHPANMYYYDVFAANDQSKPSTREFGQLATFSSDAFLTIMWQLSADADPQFMLDLVMFDTSTTRGSLDVFAAGPLTVMAAPATTNNKSVPFGLVAAWTCGGRAFGWLAYAASETMLRPMLDETLRRFTCGE